MFPVGHVLDGTYRIERLIGRGGMACVFVVSHIRLPRRFALKVITAPVAQGSEYLMRFRREAEILAELEHPNLVTVNDWNVTPEGKPYLVMELLNGEDLSQCLSRTGALPPKVALSIFAQAAEALQVAHARNIVHRDLKPANIFLCKNGMIPHFVKVLDFGIAKSAQHSGGAVTEQLVLMGTPAYMAPEQAQGNVAVIDARTDQFALALVLYEMLSGRSAFHRRGETPMLTIYRVITEDPPPLSDERMNRALMRALKKDPDGRYPSLAEFVSAVISCAPEPIELPEKTDRMFGDPAIAPEHRARPSGASPAVAQSGTEPATTDDGGPDSISRSTESNPPRTNPPSLPKSVLSNITQPGAELVAHKRSPRPKGLIISSGAVLLLVGLWFATGMAQKYHTRKPDAPQVPDNVLLPAVPATNPSAPDSAKAAGGESDKLPKSPDPAGLPPVTSAGQTDRPAGLTDPAKVTGRAKSLKRQANVHVEPVLTGVDGESPAAKIILGCVRTVFGSNPRRSSGLVIRLSRTDRLKVGSQLPAERSLQLEDCLSSLPTSDIPRRAVISFEEK